MVGREVKLSKNNKQYKLWIGLGLVIVAMVLIAIVVVNAMKGEATGDVKIGGEAEVTGLVCRDTASIHPALASVPMGSHTDTVTASFQNDKLSSISLMYEGDYGTEKAAESAEAFVRSDYNEILIKKYGEKIDIFSANFSANGAKMQMVQTARDISRINSNTVTYFLLDQGTSIAKTLEGLKKQYEAKGFTCEKSN